MVEGAWASRYPAHVRRHLHLRLATHPTVIQAISGTAPVRWCQRARRLMARGPHAHHVVVALARARVGCMGAMANQGAVSPSRVADSCPPP
jgi:hypothetical protein